ncbi:MAG: APC family permease [Candidatus Dormibacteria bacterium]
MAAISQGVSRQLDVEAEDRKLDRRMSVWNLFFLSMGGIIGSGWLFASLAAAAVAGPAAIVSWIIGGCLVLLVALNYAEISGMMPRSGAIVRYPHLTHGGYTGFILGWTYLLSAVSVPAIEAEAVVTYASTYIHGIINPANSELTWPAGILFGIGLMIVFFIFNFIGIRFMSRSNHYITLWKFLIPTLTFILLFAFGMHTKNYASYGGFAPLGWQPVLGAVATTGIVFSYLGFRQALDFGGEARNPQRDVPRATIASVLAGMVLYVLLQAAFIGAIKWGVFGVHAGDWAALKAAGSAAKDAPFYVALKAAGPALLGGFATVLLIDAFVSPGGTGVVYLGTSSRTTYGLSMVGYLPSPFRAILARTRIPWIALIASFVVACLFFLPLPSWYELVGVITSATVLTYIMGGIGVPVLRQTAGSLHRPFRLPLASIIAPAGFIGALMIVYWSGFVTLALVFGAVFVALPIFVWFYAPQQGWIKPQTGWLLGLVFLVLWIIVQRWGGWVLTAAPLTAVHPAFGVYYFTTIVLVMGFTGILWYACNPVGRKAVQSTWWLIYFLLAVFGLSYFGSYGPLKVPGLTFPSDLLVVIMVGLLSYGWAVRSGYATPELQTIIDTGTAVIGDEPGVPVTPATAPTT